MPQVEPQTHMQREILSQPDCWYRCLTSLESDPVVDAISAGTDRDAEWLFIGCGTSYYVAISAAASFATICGHAARAVPASEVLLFPATVTNRNEVAVLISRSGRTSEAVKAMDAINQRGNIKTITVTCASDSAFVSRGHFPILLPAAYEQSTVMTQSFSSMLLCLQFLAAKLAKDESLCAELKDMPRLAQPLFDTVPDQVQNFVARHDFEDYVFLGQGPFYGITCESALKVMEWSCSYAQSFLTLEFRHGPKSMAGPKTLVGFLISDKGYAAEVDLLEEVKDLGSKTFVITPKSEARLPWGQLLGLYTGLKKGLNPDSPRNLSQVVILDETF